MKVPREPGREVEREAAPPAAPRQAAADRVLALQSTAGNRAVAAMLAREPDAPVQADAKGAPKDKPPAPPSGPHVVLGGIGAIALEGFSMAGRQTPGGGGRGQGRERDRPPPQEFQLTTRAGSHSSDLMRAATNGKGMDGEIVLKGGVKIILKGAMVTSYNVSGSDKDADRGLDAQRRVRRVRDPQGCRGRREESGQPRVRPRSREGKLRPFARQRARSNAAATTRMCASISA